MVRRLLRRDPGGGLTGGQLQHLHQEPGHAGGTVAASQIGGLSVGYQAVVDQWQPVAEGFEALPYGDLLCCCELIKTVGFNGFHEFGQVVVKFVEDHIQPTALSLHCCWIPEFHTNILFEPVFDDKLFSHKIRKVTPNIPPDALILIPGPAPGAA